MSEPQAMLPEDRSGRSTSRRASPSLTVLSACARADFLFLERATGLTRGNLSVQLSRLEESGLIEIEKIIVQKKTVTTAALLGRGRGALASLLGADGRGCAPRSVAPQKAAVKRPSRCGRETRRRGRKSLT